MPKPYPPPHPMPGLVGPSANFVNGNADGMFKNAELGTSGVLGVQRGFTI